MKILLISIVSLIASNAFAGEKIKLGTIYDGPVNTIVFSKNKTREITITAGYRSSWGDDIEEDLIRTKVPGLRMERGRYIIYKGAIIGKQKLIREDDKNTLYQDVAHIEAEQEVYCVDEIEGDCILGGKRTNIYLIIN